MSVSKRVGEILNESELSGPKIAERLGVSFTTISNLKRGNHRSIGSDFLEEFFREFPHVSIEWVFTGKGPKERLDPSGKLKELGIDKPIDPSIAELILHMYEVNESLTKQINTQAEVIKRSLLKP